MPGIAGVDTRRLTRIIRETGAIPGAFGAGSEADLLAAARREPGTDGVDLVSHGDHAGRATRSTRSIRRNRRRIVAVDFGMKRHIGHHLSRFGAVDVVPASTTADEILARQPDGVFLSNGPGDPAMCDAPVEAIKGLLGRGSHLRDLPRPPAAGPGHRRRHA